MSHSLNPCKGGYIGEYIGDLANLYRCERVVLEDFSAPELAFHSDGFVFQISPQDGNLGWAVILQQSQGCST